MKKPVARTHERRPASGRVPPGRDAQADRALFEEAIERLGPIVTEKPEDDVPAVGGAAGGARFRRRVARGEVTPGDEIDLHGDDRRTAAERLRRFLRATVADVVLVVHGKGLGVLEATVVAELDAHPRVAEHVRAPAVLGGAGARLVRLQRR
jgi:DNA-nicking Smr family endonuclease